MKYKGLLFLMPFLICILFAFLKHSNDIKEIDLVEAFKQKHKINLSTIVESIEYIPLKSNQSNYVGRYPRVYANSQHIIIIALKQQFVFDRRTRKFIREIGHYGRDPSGYRRTKFSIAYDEDNNTFYADGWDGSIMEYSIDNEILDTYRRPETIKLIPSFAKLNDTVYFAYVLNTTGDEKTKLVVFNNGKNKKISFIPNYDYYENDPNFARSWGPGIGWFYRYNGQLFLKELFIDTIYGVGNNSLSPKYVFSSGKFNPPSVKREFINNNDYKGYYWIQRVFESSKYVFFELIHNEKKRIGLYDKKKSITSISELEQMESYCSEIQKCGFFNDIDSFIQFYPETVNSRGEVIGLIQACEILKWFEKNPEKAGRLPTHLQEFKNIKETDNPIVMIAKLKK